MSEALTDIFRPSTYDEVIGQQHVINSLRSFKKGTLPHAFLFSGGTGLGKTTIARIVAGEVDCDLKNLIEIDGATYTGVDIIKSLCKGLKYPAHGKNPIKFVIIDECHRISPQSFDSLLKIIEEPPKHLYFAFCTTNLNKIPKTIQTRCTHYHLKDVNQDDLFELLEFISQDQDINLDDICLRIIIKVSYGSPRRAVNFLNKCRNCKSLKEVKEILEQPEDDGQVIELCREIIKGADWNKIITIIKSFEGKDYESVRINICNYLNVCILKARSGEQACKLLGILESFSTPVYSPTGVTDLLLSIGDLVFGND